MIELRIALAVGAVALAACADLPAVDLDRCGNGVLEPEAGEACDRPGADCGAPGEAAACRLRCGTAGEGAVCPPGAACGLDDVCRVPSQRFAITADVRWSSPALLVGDTTGDGYPEMIGVGATTMEARLGAPGAAYAAAFSTPSLHVTERPSFGDLNGDGAADLVMPAGIGLFAMLGDPFAVLQPLFQTSFPLPTVGRVEIRSVPFDGEDGLPSSKLLAALRIVQGSECPAPVGCQGLLFGDGFAPLPDGQDVERLADAALAWAAHPASRELVVAVAAFADDPGTIEDEGGVYVFDAMPATEQLTLRGPIALPGRVRHGAWLADVDGDGRADLLASVAAGPAELLTVSWGRVDGGFEVASPLPGTGGLGGGTVPIAAGDLDGDGRADLITSTGVLLNDCVARSCGFATAVVSGSRRDAAVIADVNGDGRADLASHDGGSTIEVLLGTSIRGLFSSASLTAPGEVVALRAGDYDGNGVADLAFVTRLPDLAGSDELHVAFGMPGGPPREVTFMGRVGELIAIDNAMAPVPGQLDAIDDLVMLNEQGGVRGGALVLGSTSRRLVAPLLPLVSPGFEDGFHLIEQVVTADLDGDPFADVICLVDAIGSLAYAQQIRIYRSDTLGSLVEYSVPGELVIPLDAFTLFGSRWIAIPPQGSTPAQLVGADARGRVIGFAITCDATSCTAGALVPLAADGERGPVTTLHAADLDGDGDLDLISAFASSPELDSATGAAATIWRNSGGFSAAGREELTVPVGHFVIDAAAIDLELDGTQELLVVTRDDPGGAELFPGSVYVVRAGADGRYGELEAFKALTLAGGDVRSGLTLVATDVSGDGLVDLTLMSGADRASPQTLVVAVQVEAAPGEVVTVAP